MPAQCRQTSACTEGEVCHLLREEEQLCRNLVRSLLDGVPFAPDPIFSVLVPSSCPGVPHEILQPRQTWADRAAYDAQAIRLADLVRKNFEQFDDAPAAVRASGPAVRG
jgi:phosphoenolpyruvate carboxykinase (ATP)